MNVIKKVIDLRIRGRHRACGTAAGTPMIHQDASANQKEMRHSSSSSRYDTVTSQREYKTIFCWIFWPLSFFFEKSAIRRFAMNCVPGQRSSWQPFYRPLFLYGGLMLFGPNRIFLLQYREWPLGENRHIASPVTSSSNTSMVGATRWRW